MPTMSALKTPPITNRKMPEDWLARLRQPPPHPGTVFKEMFREPLKISQAEAARRLGFRPYFWGQVELGRRPVTVATAVKLEALTHVSAEFWATMQMHRDLWEAMQQAKGLKRVIPGDPFPRQAAPK